MNTLTTPEGIAATLLLVLAIAGLVASILALRHYK